MDNDCTTLTSQAEPLASLSTAHLTPDTLALMAEHAGLGVIYYENEYGAFVYVGVRSDPLPARPDLRACIELARAEGFYWLKFDSSAALIDGLLVYEH